jgi:anti-sigma B factor antagonist
MADLTPREADDLVVELVSDEDNVATFKVSGQLDASTENVLRTNLQQAINAGADRLVVETSGLQFMDSSGLAVLLGAARNISHLELRHPSDVIHRLITIAGLTEALPVTFDA